MHYLDQQGNYYTGEQAPGGISVNAKPSNNYRLKEDWKAQIPDVWELDLVGFKTSVTDKLNKVCGDKLEEVIKLYPKNEDATWPTQITQAEKWKALTPEEKISSIHSSDFSSIFTIATGNNFIDISLIGLVDTLVAKILRNKLIFEVFSGKVLFQKRSIKTEIDISTTEDQLKLVDKKISLLYTNLTLVSVASELGV